MSNKVNIILPNGKKGGLYTIGSYIRLNKESFWRRVNSDGTLTRVGNGANGTVDFRKTPKKVRESYTDTQYKKVTSGIGLSPEIEGSYKSPLDALTEAFNESNRKLAENYSSLGTVLMTPKSKTLAEKAYELIMNANINDRNNARSEIKSKIEEGWTVLPGKHIMVPTGYGGLTYVLADDFVSPDESQRITLNEDLSKKIDAVPKNTTDPADNFLNDLLFGAITGGAGFAKGVFTPAIRNFARRVAFAEGLSKLANETYKHYTGSENGYMHDLYMLGSNGKYDPGILLLFDLSDPAYYINPLSIGRGLTNVGRSLIGNRSPIRTNLYEESVKRYSHLFDELISKRPFGAVRIGNNYYRVDPNSMSVGFPKIERTPVWQVEQPIGINPLIKSLMVGSPLERQVSKTGTISVKQLLAYIGRNDVSTIDKHLIDKALENHIGETHLDYNVLRREVLEMIPKYERVPLTNYSMYGSDRLGHKLPSEPDNEWFVQNDPDVSLKYYYKDGEFYDRGTNLLVRPYDVRRFIDNLYYSKPIPKIGDNISYNTFTFESPGIKGNTKHYEGNPLGHSRTYTTVEEPEVLHVMESLSDWALGGGSSNAVGKRNIELALNNVKNNLESGNYGFYSKEELELKVLDLTKKLESFNLDPVQSRMVNTYSQRHIQENLRLAAENGQTKMRYPTRESAVKIEGYTPAEVPTSKKEISDRTLQYINEDMSKLTPYTNFIVETLNKLKDPLISLLEKNKLISLLKRVLKIEQRWLNGETTYSLEHETILNHYSDYPKQYEKLFGKGTVREVTDAKDNTWYEVDVPEAYRNGNAEILFGYSTPSTSVNTENYNNLLNFINNDIIPRLKSLGHDVSTLDPSKILFRLYDPIKDYLDRTAFNKMLGGAWYWSPSNEITIRGPIDSQDFGLLGHEAGGHWVRQNLNPEYKAIPRSTWEKGLKIARETGLDLSYGNLKKSHIFNESEILGLSEAYPWVENYKGLSGNQEKILHERGSINTLFRAKISELNNHAIGKLLDIAVLNTEEGLILHMLIEQPYTNSIVDDISKITGLSSDDILFMSTKELTLIAKQYPKLLDIVNKCKKTMTSFGAIVPIGIGIGAAVQNKKIGGKLKLIPKKFQNIFK